MNRRSFLAAAGAAPAALAAPEYAPVLQAGVYVWTQHYSRLGQRAQDHVNDICMAFARAGFRDVELMSLFFEPGLDRVTLQALERAGLACSTVYNGGPLHTPESARQTIATTVELAQRILRHRPLDAIVFNPNPVGRAKTDEELKVQAEALNTLGWALWNSGVRLMLHQHAPELADNGREWRYMLAHTERRWLRVCLDTHWVYRAGLDVMTLLKECGPRLYGLHVRNSRGGVWTEDFGDGDIDYRAVARHLREAGFTGYLSVELAWDKETRVTRPLEENLRRSLQYARDVFGIAAG
ncbi:MAG: sugar phosphate isomerase/epimerase family protein [Bryobacteraceae bacterium]|jgi:inosose dehydratase